ncbi:ketopantoate reductase family protein [Paenibacillus caui]|uniref:ketopantoate reductase family protein n=1 Tax=Paenibacillus caui TaxID=2873927 RepID=UPI001F265FBE|nr:2-dehydropantoate 2-reductase [Paenibacillus caui]
MAALLVLYKLWYKEISVKQKGEMNMRLEIVGAGALGLLLSGGLASAGHDVRIWTRTAEQADLINTQGIETQREGKQPETVLAGIEAVSWEAEHIRKAREGHSADWILLTVKQRHIAGGLLDALPLLQGEKTGIVCFQNGMGHFDLLKCRLKEDSLYAALTTEGARQYDKRSVIRSEPGETRLGPVFTGDSVELEKLAGKLQEAGFRASVSNHIDREIHRKLMINAAINPLTALWRIPNGELLASPHRRSMLDMLIAEGLAVYDACGIPYDTDLAEQIAGVCRTTSGNISSMLADVLRGEPTEVDYINGYLAAMARKSKVAAPAHEMVWKLLKGINESG